MNTAATSIDPTVLIERLFPHAPEQVFDAWANPALLTRWFAPQGCTIHFEYLDVKTGGGFHSCIHNPAFGQCWTVAEFREVTRPRRIVFDWHIADAQGQAVSPQSQGHDPDWPAGTQVVVTFEARDGGTLVRLAQNVSEALAKRTGAHPSWIQMLDRLEGLLVAGQERAHG